MGEPIVKSATQGPTTLTVAFDPVQGSYTLTTGAVSATFTRAQLDSGSTDTEQYWTLGGGSNIQFLSILHLNSAHAGFWQRSSAGGSIFGADLDAFVYGAATPPASMPISGTASYNVSLSGVALTPGDPILDVYGTGTFQADFLKGSYHAAGQAEAYSIGGDFSSWPRGWQGDGFLTAGTGQFQGDFTIAAGDRDVSGPAIGSFFGPGADEVGAAIRGSNSDGTVFVGTLLGGKIVPPDTGPADALPNGRDRTYYSVQDIVGLSYDSKGATYNGGARFIPASFGSLRLNADGSIAVTLDAGSSTTPRPAFASTDRIAAESSLRDTVYANVQNGVQYKLTLSNPGPDNDRISLTYSSFGNLEAIQSVDGVNYVLQTWLTYGVMSQNPFLGRTGTGSYQGIVQGSGVSYVDGSRYALAGTAGLTLNFDTLALQGELRPVATLVSGSLPVDLPVLTFSTTISGTAFSGWSGVGSNNVDFDGRVYGPTAEEIAGTFHYAQRNAAGFPQNWFTGIFATKIKP